MPSLRLELSKLRQIFISLFGHHFDLLNRFQYLGEIVFPSFIGSSILRRVSSDARRSEIPIPTDSAEKSAYCGERPAENSELPFSRLQEKLFTINNTDCHDRDPKASCRR